MGTLVRVLGKILRPKAAAAELIDGWVVCGGDSMEPTVCFGQQVRVRPCRRARAGEVVVLSTLAEDTQVLHRVVLKVPCLPWFVHVGDSPTCRGPSLASTTRVLGCAELPRRRPSFRVWLSGVKRVAEGARNVLVRADGQ